MTILEFVLNNKDYLEDLTTEAAKERREAPPATESEYVFNTIAETDKGVYFFDERQQPKVPGQPADSEYKKEKRLWKKPKRYTPEQYYGMQGDGGSSSSTSEETSYDYKLFSCKNTRSLERVFFMSNFFALQESGNTIGKNSIGAVLR